MRGSNSRKPTKNLSVARERKCLASALAFTLSIAFLLSIGQTPVSAVDRIDQRLLDFELNTSLMKATFLISGNSCATGTPIYGTAFCLVKPLSDVKEGASSTEGSFVLVTAKHVFDGISGDFANLDLRCQKPDGAWVKYPIQLRIRKNGSNLYVSHPLMDVSALQLDPAMADIDKSVQASIEPLPVGILCTDESFASLRLHPGSTVNCLGYPLRLESNLAGFAILRGGMIASYPNIPFQKNPLLALDFEVYPGNSGGPVYYFEPGFQSPPNELLTLTKSPGFTIIGLVSAQIELTPILQPNQSTIPEKIFPKIGYVVTGPYIKETIDLLPKIHKR